MIQSNYAYAEIIVESYSGCDGKDRTGVIGVQQEQVLVMMKEIGLPCAYDHFSEGQSPEPPFLVFLYPESRNFATDGVAYFKKNKLHIELYTEFKSAELEERVEAVLERCLCAWVLMGSRNPFMLTVWSIM